jgi:hypothetical protein
VAYEIKGLVKSVSAVKVVTEKFAKRELVLEVDPSGKYPQTLQFETSGDRNTLLDAINEGDTVTIQFDLRGRAKRDGDGAWNTLSVWKINVDSKAASRAPAPSLGTQDDIPF